SFKENVLLDSKIHSAHTAKTQTMADILHFLSKVPYMAVLPKLNNPRIVNQDGAFFLFGMKVKEVIKSDNPGTYNRIYYEFEKLKSPSDSKSLILNELSAIGISKNKMFPELEYQAEFITNKIKNE